MLARQPGRAAPGSANYLSLLPATSGNGEALGQYAYAPFGEPLAASPARIGFSSELFDASTRLAYYNYRHLAPRWSREPMG